MPYWGPLPHWGPPLFMSPRSGRVPYWHDPPQWTPEILAHWEEALKEFKDGRAPYNIFDRPELEYLANGSDIFDGTRALRPGALRELEMNIAEVKKSLAKEVKEEKKKEEEEKEEGKPSPKKVRTM